MRSQSGPRTVTDFIQSSHERKDNCPHNLERGVQFNDSGKKSLGRIDLYKRGCFVLETKQGTDSPDAQQQAQRAELGLPPEKRRKGHAVRGTTKWAEMMQAAR